MSRVAITRSVLCLATLLSAIAGGTASAQVGLTVSREADSISRLYRLNLETAAFGEVANLGSLLEFAALDRGPDGLIYGLEWRGDLYAIGAVTGAAEMIGELSTVDPTGLAFAPDGGLWVVAGQTLERVDPATGATQESLALDQELKALAATGDQLYGFSSGWHLWAIDTGSGDLTSIADLSGMSVGFIDADFDESGTLWIVGSGTGPVMGTVFVGFYSVPDPPSGEVIEHYLGLFTFGDDDPRIFFGGLVMEPQRAIDIPALSGAGTALLIALLAVLGTSVVRRFARDP